MLPLVLTCHCWAVEPVHVASVTRVPLAVPATLMHLPLCGLTALGLNQGLHGFLLTGL